MPALTPATLVCKAHVPFREAPGFLVIAAPGGTQVEFDGSSPDIWAQIPNPLQKPTTVEAIGVAVAAEVSLPVSEVAPAVLATLQDMVDHEVIDVY